MTRAEHAVRRKLFNGIRRALEEGFWFCESCQERTEREEGEQGQPAYCSRCGSARIEYYRPVQVELSSLP